MMTVAERLREKLERHGPDSPNASERNDYIRAAARRVADRLAAVTRRWSERQVSRRCTGPGSSVSTGWFSLRSPVWTSQGRNVSSRGGGPPVCPGFVFVVGAVVA
jgi:hypothetical protein